MTLSSLTMRYPGSLSSSLLFCLPVLSFSSDLLSRQQIYLFSPSLFYFLTYSLSSSFLLLKFFSMTISLALLFMACKHLLKFHDLSFTILHRKSLQKVHGNMNYEKNFVWITSYLNQNRYHFIPFFYQLLDYSPIFKVPEGGKTAFCFFSFNQGIPQKWNQRKLKLAQKKKPELLSSRLVLQGIL